MSKKNHCSRRTSPANRNARGKSQLLAPNWRKTLFKVVFKVIEAVWMLVQIIQQLGEIFR